MSIIPEITVGWGTAWWFSVIYVIGMYLPLLIFFPKESWARLSKGSDSEFTKNMGVKRKIMNAGLWITWLGLIFYAIFIPVEFGTFYFYFGLVVFGIGMLLYEISLFNYASTPVGQPVTSGLYKISRNPLYVFEYLLWIGIGILTASLVILLVKTVVFVLIHYTVIGEEHFCLEKYGKSYENYMQNTPRYLGISK